MTSNLPPAIALVAQVLAADAGRARADTLLAIQGADPAYVRTHLAAIDAALGAASPGLAPLTALVDQAENVVSTSSPTVARQHVISQVVLRKFVEEVPPHGRVLARYALATPCSPRCAAPVVPPVIRAGPHARRNRASATHARRLCLPGGTPPARCWMRSRSSGSPGAG